MNTDCLGIELFWRRKGKTDEKKGKLMSMDRIKYLYTDFLVYQLSERKVVFFNTRRLNCFM